MSLFWLDCICNLKKECIERKNFALTLFGDEFRKVLVNGYLNSLLQKDYRFKQMWYVSLENSKAGKMAAHIFSVSTTRLFDLWWNFL